MLPSNAKVLPPTRGGAQDANPCIGDNKKSTLWPLPQKRKGWVGGKEKRRASMKAHSNLVLLNPRANMPTERTIRINAQAPKPRQHMKRHMQNEYFVLLHNLVVCIVETS